MAASTFVSVSDQSLRRKAVTQATSLGEPSNEELRVPGANKELRTPGSTYVSKPYWNQILPAPPPNMLPTVS